MAVAKTNEYWNETQTLEVDFVELTIFNAVDTNSN